LRPSAITGAGVRAIWIERGCLVALVAVTAAFYVPGLGVYSDGWGVLSILRLSSDQSVGGLYTALAREANLAVRPLQILWYILFQKLSPASIVPAHYADSALFALSLVVLHASLVGIPGMRRAAFVIPLAFACMPNFVTAKLWFANHQSIVALLFACLAFRLCAPASLPGARRALAWRLAAIFLCALASGLAYELYVALIVAFPLFAFTMAGGRLRDAMAERGWKSAAIAAAGGAAGAFAWKLPYFVATGNTFGGADFPLHAAALYARVGWLDFWTLGLFLPRAAIGVATGPFAQPLALAAVLVTAPIMLVGLGQRKAEAGEALPMRLLYAAAIAFVLGYAPLLSSFHFGWEPFGIGNRTNAAGALGIAIGAAALYLLAASRWPRAALAVLCLYCLSGVLVQVTVGRIWDDAWRAQQSLYHGMIADIAPVAPGDIVLLYGQCPYHGVAPQFSSSWGLADRLRLRAGSREVRADTLGPTSRLLPGGIAVSEYGSTEFYPYGPLRIYVVGERREYPIRSAQDARSFFAAHPLDRASPCQFYEGEGVALY
jgi:hypothetical protein